MKQVDFLYYENALWQFPLSSIAATVGLSLVLLGVVLVFMHNDGDVHKLLQLGEMEHSMVRIRIQIAKGLLGWSMLLVPLIAVYDFGAGEYECGKIYLYWTAAYLRDHPSAEWTLAVAACISFAGATWCICALRVHIKQNMIMLPGREPSTRQRIYLWLLWTPICCLLSTPMIVYILSTSLPANENTIGLGSATLFVMQRGAGPMLYCISALMVPPLARLVIQTVTGSYDSATAARLMTGARLIVSLLAPFVTILALNQQCFAWWLKLWKPCQDPAQFKIDITAKLTAHTVVGTFQLYHAFPVTSHDEICAPTYNSGECPRAVIDTLGSLIFDKVLFTALIGPLRVLLMNTRTWRRGQEWLVRNILRARSYELTCDMDTESAGIVMLLQLLLTFGFVIPALVPVVCLGFLLHGIAFHLATKHQGVELMYEARPPMGSLWFSLGTGVGLVIWLFVECDWSGSVLVLAATPCMLVVALGYMYRTNSNDTTAADSNGKDLRLAPTVSLTASLLGNT